MYRGAIVKSEDSLFDVGAEVSFRKAVSVALRSADKAGS